MTVEQKKKIDELKAKLKAAQDALAAEQDPAKKAELQTKVAEAEAALKVAEAEAAAGGSEHVELPDGRVQMLTPAAFKKLKDGARDKGRKELMSELNAQAKEHGFESYEAMMLAASAAKKNGKGGQPPAPPARAATPPTDPNAPPAPPEPPRAGRGDRKAWDRYQRAMSQWEKEKAAFDQRTKKAEKRARQAERDLAEAQARGQLERIAMQSGITDTDYAITLLRRHVAPMSEDELKAFDETKFFRETLKESHGYLYGAPGAVTPATTGTPGPGPTPPKPGTPPANGSTDVRKMSREEFNADLRRRGLSVPTM